MHKTIYVKYSNDRAPEFMISTHIVMSDDGKKSFKVYKLAESPESRGHIHCLYDNYHKLMDAFSRQAYDEKDIYRIEFNHCSLEGERACFDYVQGESMGQRLCRLYNEGRTEEFYSIIDRYIRTLRAYAFEADYAAAQHFEAVFKDVDLSCISSVNKKSFKTTDIDLNTDNLFITENDNMLTVIDYEWVFDFNVPVGYIIYRVLKYISIDLTGMVEAYKGKLGQLCERFGISGEEAAVFEQMDSCFGEYVRRGHIRLGELNYDIGKAKVMLKNNWNDAMDGTSQLRAKVAALREYCDAYEIELERSRAEVKSLREHYDVYEKKISKIKNTIIWKMYKFICRK